MTKTTTAERMARKMIESRTTESLCEMFEATNNTSGEKIMEEAMVRGWIMDELQKRNADAFDRWMDCDDMELIDFPSRFFLAPAMI